MKIRAMAIFCGSKMGSNTAYMQQAKELGSILGRHNVAVIYGGGKRGLMGSVANAALSEGGIVKGVMPRLLADREHSHDEISDLIIVDGMHERKKILYDFCDAAIILPGGFGTLDEMFEIITWNQLTIHDKKIFVLNTAGFYDGLLQHLQKLGEEGFLYTNLNECMTVLNEPGDILQHLEN